MADEAQHGAGTGGDGPPRWRLQLLGPFGLTSPSGKPVAITGRKNRATLGLLALSPGQSVSRERLIGLLWSDRAEEQARSSLRQSLAELRRNLGSAGDTLLDTGKQQLAILPGSMTCDAVTLLAAETSDKLASLRAAAALWTGPLLADLVIRDQAFEEWLAPERARLIAAAIRIHDRLASLEQGEARIEWARRLLALDTLREASHRALMQALLDAGERAQALRQFDLCRRLLRDELGVDPAPETLALGNAIAKPAPAPEEPPETSHRPSIAVLPFANIGDDPDQKFFSDGVTGDIVSGLARFRHVDVISRSSSARFHDAREAAAALKVRYVVEGTVRRLGTRIRVTASLVEAATGRSLWSGNYDRDASGIFDVQDELVQTIVATLGGRVTAESTREARRRPPSSLAAYELALRANALDWEEADGRAEAKALLNQALGLDPGYAAAHSLLAAILVQELVELHSPASDNLETALRHARRAVELDEGDSSHHSIIGWIHQLNGHYEEAEACMARALELNPGNPYAMCNRGTLATLQGRPDEGIEWLQRTARSDPYFNPAWIHEETGLAHFAACRYPESLDILRKSPRRSFISLALIAASLAMLDRAAEARAASADLLRLRPACTVAMLARLFPFREANDRAHFEEALKSAGLPS